MGGVPYMYALTTGESWGNAGALASIIKGAMRLPEFGFPGYERRLEAGPCGRERGAI